MRAQIHACLFDATYSAMWTVIRAIRVNKITRAHEYHHQTVTGHTQHFAVVAARITKQYYVNILTCYRTL